jgi:hypothetical protein
MVRDILLALHIAAGSIGLLLLPVIIIGAKGTPRHRRLGRGFLWCLRAVAATAAGLAIIDFARLWWFLLIATFSLALGEVGSRGWRRQPFGPAVSQHLAGMGGAAIAFVTAVLVVNFGMLSVAAWIAPTLIGSPIIAIVTARYQRRGSVAPPERAWEPADGGRIGASPRL